MRITVNDLMSIFPFPPVLFALFFDYVLIIHYLVLYVKYFLNFFLTKSFFVIV